MGHDYANLQISIGKGIATVRLSNPPVNALSKALLEELTAAFDYLSEQDSVRAIVLTGNGHVFCAGADLKGRSAVLKKRGDMSQHSRRTRECFHAIRECSKPVIAAINGAALGAGLAIVASCDILVSASDAVVGLPEINVGLLGGGRHAMRLFGHSRVRHMMLTGTRISGDELYRLGVVEASVSKDELIDIATGIAEKIAEKSPLSIRLAKRTLNAIEEMSLRDGYRYEQDMTAVISKTNDAAEAQQAFIEKRKPNFKGN